MSNHLGPWRPNQDHGRTDLGHPTGATFATSTAFLKATMTGRHPEPGGKTNARGSIAPPPSACYPERGETPSRCPTERNG